MFPVFSFTNQGASCYLSSTIQCLWRSGFSKSAKKERGSLLLRNFNAVISSYEARDREAFDEELSYLRVHFARQETILHPFLNRNRQMDASEFFSDFVGCVDDNIKRSTTDRLRYVDRTICEVEFLVEVVIDRNCSK